MTSAASVSAASISIMEAYEHGGNDRLASFGRGGDLRSQRKHRSHVHPREGAQTEQDFDFGTVFAQRRGAHGIAGEVVGRTHPI